MGKRYKYTKNNKLFAFEANDDIENFLRINKKISGESPEEFIQDSVNSYPSLDIESTINICIKDTIEIYNNLYNLQNIQLDKDDKKTIKLLNELTGNLNIPDEIINKFTDEVTK